MPLHLITELELNRLDDADRTATTLIDRYLDARRRGDELGMRRYEALAADFDLLYPEAPVTPEFDGFRTLAAA
ncbi:hypothetical protein [Streptomyces sp. NRRL F-2664]|jgi:hypothetical protein|uniref:hypothetical protein n=1 Tax=Streptomyces sp. NRRL F-2664 TaxID=1463842 RepID=UPI0004C72312|nr:hypothetical protein [Streptomyces sp. NRRL F-2664]